MPDYEDIRVGVERGKRLAQLREELKDASKDGDLDEEIRIQREIRELELERH